MFDLRIYQYFRGYKFLLIKKVKYWLKLSIDVTNGNRRK